MIDPDVKYPHIHKSKLSRMDKIVKDPNKPSPGVYNTIEAFNKTQTENTFCKMVANPKPSKGCYIDTIIK